MKKVLYISYDGMTDPLGQSQVIPYLRELALKKIEIHILSAEKPENFLARKDYISELLQSANIVWHPTKYTKKPPVLSTVKDIYILKKTAIKLHRKHGFDIVHCRSYIAAFAGMVLKKKFGVSFLFDMRGFYADERVDGNLWPQTNPLFRAVYKYFKRKEKQFLLTADHTISLTYKGRETIHSFSELEKIPIEVIPCCADIKLFDYNNIDHEAANVLKTQLKIADDDFVICYLGSIGTWYLPDEMMGFFKVLVDSLPKSKFLFITRDEPELIYHFANKNNVNPDSIIIKPANREEVPLLISLCKASIFFIKPVFSKIASSPTKLAEILGMGIPVICNANVGDIDKFVPENKLGLMIEKLDDEGYRSAVAQIDELLHISPEHLRRVADELFSLDVGVERYYNVYKKLLGA